MIVSKNGIKKTPGWLHACILLMAVALLPLGLAYAEKGAADRLGERGEPGRNATIEETYNRMGVTDETVAKIQNHFQENGITDDQIEEVMGGLTRVVHQAQSEGGATWPAASTIFRLYTYSG